MSAKSQIRKSYVRIFPHMTMIAVVAFAVITACTGEQAKAKPNLVHKDAPKPGIVAKVGDEEITEDQLIGDSKLDFFELKKREYDLKMDRLNKIMVEKLIGSEAKAANMSTEDYINKKIVGGDIKIAPKDVTKFIAEKHLPESQITPQVKERIVAYLQQMKRQELIDNHVAKLTKANPVEVYFNKPKVEVKVEAGNGPSFGGDGAKVQIVEFSDFQCPYCSRAAETVDQVKKKYGNKIRLTFRNFPLPMHHDAEPAAEAAACVADQGTPKFWKFHDLAFHNQDKLDPASLAKWAKEAGADDKKFKECVDTKKFASQVKDDQAYGDKIGVRSTPTFFINGQLVQGALPLDQFSEVIDEELATR